MKLIPTANLIILLVISEFSSAQIVPGAKQIALSHSTIAKNNDVFDLFSNNSALSLMDWREIGIYYSPAPFGLKELSNAYAVYHEPTKLGSFGVGFSTYGFKLYRENVIAFGYSTKLYDNYFIGLTILYKLLNIDRYGKTSTVSFNVSGLGYIQNNLRLGFVFENISRTKIGNTKEPLPVSLAAGISYDPIPTISIGMSVTKDLERDPTYNFGIDYSIIKYITLRTGLTTEPPSFSFGLGINYSYFELDYAAFNHQDLGFTHQFGLIVHFANDLPRYQRIINNLKLP